MPTTDAKVLIRDGMGDVNAGTGAREDDLMYMSNYYLNSGGIVDAGDLEVTENSGGANMTVQVAPGRVFVSNTDYTANADDSTRFWVILLHATATIDIDTNTSGNPRIDVIYAFMDDTLPPGDDGDGVVTFDVEKGTPDGSPSAPTISDDAIEIAQILIPDGTTTSITDSMITNTVGYASLNLAKGVVPNNEHLSFLDSAGEEGAYIYKSGGGDLQFFVNGERYMQMISSSTVSTRFNKNIFMYPEEVGVSATIIRLYDHIPNSVANLGFTVASGQFRLLSQDAGKPIWLGTTSGEVLLGSPLIPDTDNTYDIGKTGARYDDIYATNTTIQTSDGRYKDIIETPMYGLDFIALVDPVTYKWKDYTQERFMQVFDENGEPVLDENGNEVFETIQEERTYSRYHLGFIAQDVKAAVEELGGDINTFAPFTQAPSEQEGVDGIMGLRGGELLPIAWNGLRQAKGEIDGINTIVADLTSRIEALEQA